MVRVVHKEEFEMEYINPPDASSRSVRETVVHPGQRLMRVIALSFGILCVLQVVLNVSLHLVLYKQMLNQGETTSKNVTDKWITLADQYFKQGWVYFHTSFYYISSNKTTWQKSREYCQENGADLVIINSEEEQNFTSQRLCIDYTWIGLYNKTETKQWTWVDGTQLTKSYWSPGEPNRFEGKNEHCVEIKAFKTKNSWNDEICENDNFWICEKNVALPIKEN